MLNFADIWSVDFIGVQDGVQGRNLIRTCKSPQDPRAYFLLSLQDATFL